MIKLNVSFTSVTDDTSATVRIQRFLDRVADGVEPTTDEIRAALGLVPEHLAESDQVILALIDAATAANPPITFKQIGLAMGFPESSAAQRVNYLRNQLRGAPPDRIRRRRR